MCLTETERKNVDWTRLTLHSSGGLELSAPEFLGYWRIHEKPCSHEGSVQWERKEERKKERKE
jgi:hypothetical protein